MSHYSKYLGLDDGYFPPSFKGRRGRTLIVGCITENTKPLDLIAKFVEVDGLDATDRAIEICNEFKKMHGIIEAIFTDGVTYAGFNILNPYEVNNQCKVPVITIFRHELYMNKIEIALRKHFPDWSHRFSIIKTTYERSHKVITKRGLLRITCIGIDSKVCIDLVSRLQTAFPEPQPLKIADLTASALSRLLITQRGISSPGMMRITDDD